ncbi:anti-sigma regulatory factor [Streptomyces sp. NPDC059506]|uniref:Anti-sigma regulatory factor n=1 Tax=Streptomyces thermolineatus TaxID=44033 RepID=A0ABP5Z2N6_9ACTN|nr:MULTISPECIES: anti-sigma regulatory factor [unclassified Streptomyces]MCZ2527184.1 anti-sigma regulatory factor [Streptomyces sp. HB2AG]PLW72231.1 anti-sigma regulatory factor [Streptomyces sp. DJ]QMV21260.1 anti-sigma regulatory factor [Streptomyces sp. SCUT-3]
MTAGEEEQQLPIASNDDVVRARRLVRSLAQECGLSLVDQTKLVTAVSELARNTLVHGGGGSMRVCCPQERGRRGVRAVFEDSGPGMADPEQALTDGWTTGDGLGLGLGGARRLADHFELETAPGSGTRVTVTKWVR